MRPRPFSSGGSNHQTLAGPQLGPRIVLAIAAALVLGGWTAYAQFERTGLGSDHLVLWQAAKIVLDGGDPYVLIQKTRDGPTRTNLNYPLPAIGFALPFVWLPIKYAATAFVALSVGLAAFALTKDGFHRAALFLSIPALYVAQFAQTSLMLLAMAVTPAAAGLIALKPNIALAYFAWRPAWRTVIVGGALMLGSVVVAPSWPMEWLDTVGRATDQKSVMQYPGGFLVLLALLRWRRAEARLLLVMAVVRHGLVFYDEVPLWLVAMSAREAILLTASSWIGWAAWVATSGGPADAPRMADAAQWIVLSLYLPCLVMVLRRPNVGPLPERLERLVAPFPDWLRGRAHAST